MAPPPAVREAAVVSQTPPPPSAGPLGRTIRRLREEQGFSIAELAEKSEHDAGYLTDIELGKKNPSLRIIEEIAGGLGLTIFELFESAKDS